MTTQKPKRKLNSRIMSCIRVMMVFAMLFFLSQNVTAQEFSNDFSSDFDEAGTEDLILAVFVDQKSLSSGIFAIEQNGRYYLPVAALAESIGFNIDIDAGRRFIEGWALGEEDRFSVNAQTQEIRYNEQSFLLPDEAILSPDIADDDIYLAIDVFSELWPMSLEISLSALILKVIPDDTLPFQKFLERQEQRQKLAEQKERELLAVDEDLPFLAYPYQLYGKPTLDMSLSAGYDARIDGPEYRYLLNGVQDLGYASADYAVNLGYNDGVFDRPENIRLRFTRENIHEGALPLGLEEVQWGDVSLANRELISSGSGGRGFNFSTQEDIFGTEFDLITIEGVGTPGWEVELYVNDELIDFDVVDSTGEYRFEDVSISFGNNRVRTVLYGPQGQLRENVENYFYRSNMVPTGENVFSGGIVEAEKPLIPIEERDFSRPEGLAANLYAARGINDRLTVFGTANTIRDRDGTDVVSREYVSAGAIGSVGRTLAQVEAYKQLDGGQAVDVRALSEFKGFRVNSQLAAYSDFESPDAGRDDNAKELEFDVDVRRIFNTALGSLGLEVGSEYLKRKSGIESTTYRTRQSIGTGGTRFTNTTRSLLIDGDHNSSTGRVNSTTRMRNWRLRNSLNYTLHPEMDAQSFQSELRYGRSNRYSTALRYANNFNSQEQILGLQLTRDFDKFLGSLDTEWSSDAGFSVTARAFASFGPYDSDGSYIMQSDSMRNIGPVSGFVFMDNDYDGEFTLGDEAVPDTKIEIGRRVTREETDESGYLVSLISRMGGVKDVKVSSASIDDPYLIPANAGYSIYPRAGVMHSIQFPLIETGAIDGTLRWNTGKPIAGLLLELMNDDGDIIRKSQTATDGYFTFERVPPGSYTIRANPETGVNIPFQYVDLTPEDLFKFGVDITAVDLDSEIDVGLDMGVQQDGTMQVENIVSIAKGFKENRQATNQIPQRSAASTQPQSLLRNPPASPAEVPMAAEILPVPEVTPQQPIQQAPVQPIAKVQPAVMNNTPNLQSAIQRLKTSLSVPAEVSALIINETPDVTRLTLDISREMDYFIDFDPISNSVFIEMPYASWSASNTAQANVGQIINNYRVENAGAGVRLVIGLEDSADVGASGRFNMTSNGQNQLNIDINRN